MTFKSLGEADLFDCKRCGDCCRGYGGTFVTGEDIQRIADYIHEDPERFIDKYCRVSGTKQILAQAENGYCTFWDEQCRIHPVKPRMCRQWPFISSVLIDIQNWRVMAKSCPGMRTDIPDALLEGYLRSILTSNDRPI